MHGGRMEAWFTVPGGVSVSATNGAGGPTSVAITAGAYTMATLIAHLQAQLIALRPPSTGTWSVTYSTGASGDGRVTINCTQSSGTWSLAWTSTLLRDLLGFFSNISAVGSAQTSITHARGVWLPKCPLSMAGNPMMAPRYTDLRQMETPDGRVFGHVGTSKIKHKSLVYSHVPQSQYRRAVNSISYSSWEEFLADTQWGLGHPWFSVSSKVAIYWSLSGVDVAVGSDLNVRGWYLKGIGALSGALSVEQWTGYYRIEIPEITASPSDVP